MGVQVVDFPLDISGREYLIVRHGLQHSVQAEAFMPLGEKGCLRDTLWTSFLGFGWEAYCILN